MGKQKLIIFGFASLLILILILIHMPQLVKSENGIVITIIDESQYQFIVDIYVKDSQAEHGYALVKSVELLEPSTQKIYTNLTGEHTFEVNVYRIDVSYSQPQTRYITTSDDFTIEIMRFGTVFLKGSYADDNSHGNENNYDTPGFELVLFVIAILPSLMVLQKRKLK